jgi:hypothetical protein
MGLNGMELVCGDDGADRLGISKYPNTRWGSYDELRTMFIGFTRFGAEYGDFGDVYPGVKYRSGVLLIH